MSRCTCSTSSRPSDELSRAALQDVRLHVMAEREQKARNDAGAAGGSQRRQTGSAAGSVTEAVDRDPPGPGGRRSARACSSARRCSPKRSIRPGSCTRRNICTRSASRRRNCGMRWNWRPTAPSRLRHRRASAEAHTGNARTPERSSGAAAARDGVQAAPVGRAVPHEGLAAIAGRIEEECRRLHGKYVARVEAVNALTAAVRSDIVPRLTRSTRPLKMTLPRARKAAGGAR